MKTEDDQEQEITPPAPFTEQELQSFLDDLFACYIGSEQYDGWTGRMREKHYLMLRHLQQGITS